MAQGWLVLVQGTYILWRGNDSYITRLVVYMAEIQTKNTHHGDADNCAGGASFQQHYTQVLHQQHLFSILLCLVKHYTRRQEFFGEIQGEISKTKRELYC